MNKRTALLGLTWALSIAITAWLAAHWTSAQEVAPIPEVRETDSPTTPPVPEDTAELDALRAKVAELESGQMEMLKRYLSLSLEQWAENGERVPATEADAEAMWENLKVGAGTIEGEIRLFTRFAVLGDPAARYLGKVITNRELEQEERDTALEMLSLICTPASYQALLGYQLELFPDAPYPYDSFVGLLELLPTDQVRFSFPALLNRVRVDMDLPDGHGLDALLGQIAFTHGDGQARVMLGDRRLMSQGITSLIRIAQSSGNSEARAFVESVAREHTDESMREQARTALYAWQPQ